LLGSLDYLLQLLIGIFFFHEFLTEMKVAGAVFIIAGIVVSAQWRKPQVKAGMRFQLLASLCLVAVFPIDAILVKQLSPWFVGACAYVGPVLLLYLWRSEQRREALKLIRHSQALQLAGITNAASYLLILYLLTQWNFTDTVSGGQLMICFSLLFGRFLLNEKDNPYRRLLACGLIIVGIGLFRS
jgi:drug/metabolite transporter (DMT)-like permease